ncbi:MAG: cytochrome c class I [Chitinophagaceae bacterium]|nr:cytochrome c class I [Chitinophagaceae bacterium]
MKKVFLSLAVTAILVSCGGGDSDKKTTPEVKTEPAKTEAVVDITQSPDYQKGMAIVAKQENLCLTCHKVDEKLVGPAYRDVANKYESNDETINSLAEKVVKGGKGVWGEVPMPENKVISLDDAKAAVKYVLLLKNK